MPKPLPTIAPGQSLRAVLVVVAISRPSEQVGRPVVSTEPWRSNSIEIVSSLGGSAPETVEILPPPRRVIGASRSRGSDVRREVAVGLDQDVAGAKLQGAGRRHEGGGGHQRERECDSPHPR